MGSARRAWAAAFTSYPRALGGVRMRVRVTGAGVVRAGRAAPLSGRAHQSLVVGAMHRNSDSACWKIKTIDP